MIGPALTRIRISEHNDHFCSTFEPGHTISDRLGASGNRTPGIGTGGLICGVSAQLNCTAFNHPHPL